MKTAQRTLSLGSLIASLLFPSLGCPSNNTPSNPNPPAATATPTATVPSIPMTWTQQAFDGFAFSGRMYHESVSFNSKLWVVAGWNGSGVNSIWGSPDGAVWTQAVTTAPFTGRYSYGLTTLNSKMWVIGGGVSGNDVWSSSDGVSWVSETTSAAFSGRTGQICLSYNSKLWLIGGYDGQNREDVWSSPDGVTWTQVNPSAPFNWIPQMSGCVFNGEMWVLGSGAWSSSDGVTWTNHNVCCLPPGTYSDSQAVVFNDGGGDKLWFVASNFGNSMQVLNSADGITWSLVGTSVSFSSREGFSLVAFGSRMWLIGGGVWGGPYFGDVWSYP
jgi:hypothetical protein